MALGDSLVWASQFISVDERILERIAVVWPACVAILPSLPEEDTITFNLVHLLGKDAVIRRICHWVEFQFEPSGTHPNGRKYSKGKIDIAILLDWERERYLAYECKRLNVTHGFKRSSLATAYVKEGMMRFMSDQYAEGLPIGFMLGYVIDGNTAFAMSRLTNAISSHKPLGLVTGPTTIAPIQFITRFLTTHDRISATALELRHALLPLLDAGQERS
ncbi:MAG: hypothetical protein ABFD97_10165 [Syntrophobacter sp.]